MTTELITATDTPTIDITSTSERIDPDYVARAALKTKQDAVAAAFVDLLTVQPLTEAHLFVVTKLSKLAGALD